MMSGAKAGFKGASKGAPQEGGKGKENSSSQAASNVLLCLFSSGCGDVFATEVPFMCFIVSEYAE
jgi:hypothetical protein